MSRPSTSRVLMVLLGLAVAAWTGSPRAAGPKFAVAQFDNGYGLKLVAIVQFEAADCQKLISTVQASLQLDCPQCRRDYGQCTTDLGAYQAVWRNQNFPAPYLSSGRHRYVVSGVPRQEAEAWCMASADRYRAAGLEARCVK